VVLLRPEISPVKSEEPRRIDPMVRMIVAVACSLLSMSNMGTAQGNQVTDDRYEELQKNFAEAYNRKDAGAMAAAFAEDGIRVTPSGMFQGREAIRRNLLDVLNMGLRDYRVERTISRPIGSFVFNAGEWRAKLCDQPLHGYYTAIIVRQGTQAKIMEETVTIAAPGQ
jgi:ketosteroid isomerase-like protein